MFLIARIEIPFVYDASPIVILAGLKSPSDNNSTNNSNFLQLEIIANLHEHEEFKV
jgi:hypothetical protein